ncbi:DUF636 domain-containing protein [Dendrothele bispora CBS 962.96]|uniref:DUF636 domain-containing protein n=1 Tax=Dendrothele bispora (strain CBS 962.96) TaxID=1314807 RepID=A0A4S8LTT2_DENBC|nr:DUF636 domain-containing protein [Dendrothele bispora CBS 962.96]
MSDSTREASCLCGGIKFTVKGDPFLYILCHCSNCKKASGSAFLANAWFKEEDINIISSEALGTYMDSATKSGSPINRQFCTKCGSTMFIRPDERNLKKGGAICVVPAPLVDGYTAWTPHRELFVEEKCPFVKDLLIRPKVKSKM